VPYAENERVLGASATLCARPTRLESHQTRRLKKLTSWLVGNRPKPGSDNAGKDAALKDRLKLHELGMTRPSRLLCICDAQGRLQGSRSDDNAGRLIAKKLPGLDWRERDLWLGRAEFRQSRCWSSHERKRRDGRNEVGL